MNAWLTCALPTMPRALKFSDFLVAYIDRKEEEHREAAAGWAELLKTGQGVFDDQRREIARLQKLVDEATRLLAKAERYVWLAAAESVTELSDPTGGKAGKLHRTIKGYLESAKKGEGGSTG